MNKSEDTTHMSLLRSKSKADFFDVSSFITAVSNFSVQYNFSSISIALIIMSVSECTSTDDNCRQGIQDSWVQSTATATVFVGAIAGQLSMGYAGDIIGRNKALLLTLALASLSALLSAIISFGSPTIVYSLIIASRFMLGVGLGGVYPLSATKASEDGAEQNKGELNYYAAAWAFFWQTPGAMTPWIIAYIFTYANMTASLKWRLLLGLGIIPGLIVTIASYYDDSTRNDEALLNMSSDNSSSKRIDLEYYLKNKKIQRKLIISGFGWFLYDICYYGTALFGGEILNSISSNDDDNVSTDASIRKVTYQQLIAISTSIPACILTIYFLKPYGLKFCHVWGFAFIAVCFLLMACLFDYLKSHNKTILFVIYCLLLFSLNAGPNVTTFIIPAQLYPPKIRSTFNGISAAFGKLGAVGGAYLYGIIGTASSYPVVMVICSIIALIGAVTGHYYWDDDYNNYDLLFENTENDIIVINSSTSRDSKL